MSRGNFTKKHGMYGSPTYVSWHAMKWRCLNPNVSDFARYGGRGILVCERWLSFENFLADMGPRPSTEHSIDRLDVNGNYEPGNCHWGTREEQSNNKRTSRLLTLDGKSATLAQWSERVGLKRVTIESRIRRGWTEQRALTEPVGRNV